MGKKNADEMAQQRGLFVGGAINRGIDEKLATLLFDLMEKFAGYVSTSRTPPLRAGVLPDRLPQGALSGGVHGLHSVFDMDNTDKVHIAYIDTLQQGVSILPPDVNTSGYRFAPTDEKTVAYASDAIKGTGRSRHRPASSRRARSAVPRPVRFLPRVDKRVVNRRAIEALIRGGAFDSISDHRHQMMASLDAALGSAEQQARAANQNSLFGDDESVSMPVMLANVERWTMREQLQKEKLALGYYFSGHPIMNMRRNWPISSS